MGVLLMRRAIGPLCTALVALFVTTSTFTNDVNAHGDVTPQAVDISGLPKLGKDWLEENPWRDPNGENWKRAIEVGASGYNQNCARCHGLGAVSGGLAPDLRLLSADLDGDEWYLERYQQGYTQGGVTKMPAFGELLGQEAAWAIRTYVETRADPESIEEHLDALQGIRKSLQEMADSGKPASTFESEVAPLKAQMIEIADKIETASEAPKADSVAANAADLLDGSKESIAKAAEVLTVGLSAAK